MINGTLYILDPETGAQKELGDVGEISLTADELDESRRSSFSTEPIISMKFELTRRDKRFWLSKVFGLPKYKVTEEVFPRKKKRGTMRRERRRRR